MLTSRCQCLNQNQIKSKLPNYNFHQSTIVISYFKYNKTYYYELFDTRKNKKNNNINETKRTELPIFLPV